jgi:two-component system, sensor histidine kinase and response regulator
LIHGLKPVAIVAMTAYALQADKNRCLDAGMNGYIAKPIKEDELRGAIDRLVFGKDGRAILPEAEEQPETIEKQPEIKEVPVFDRSSLLQRIGGDEALIATFVTMFTTSSDEHLAALAKAAAEGDAEQIRRKAHAVKGSAGNVGAVRLSVAADTLEKAIRENPSVDPSGLLAKLEEEYRLFREESGN